MPSGMKFTGSGPRESIVFTKLAEMEFTGDVLEYLRLCRINRDTHTCQTKEEYERNQEISHRLKSGDVVVIWESNGDKTALRRC